MKFKASEAYCVCCHTIKQKNDDFYKSLNPHHTNGVMPLCARCSANLYKEVFAKNGGNPAAAMWAVCSALDIPFKMDVWEDVVAEKGKQTKGISHPPVKKYVTKMYERGVPWEGFWESDRMLNSFMDIGEDRTIVTEQDAQNELKKRIRDWGKFEDVEDYDFLEATFYDYTKDLYSMDKALTMRYRDLCKAELQKRKADEGGDTKEIRTAMQNVGDLMKQLKIDNFKGNDKSDEEKRVEKRIWQIENTRPCECEDLEVYRDYSGFEKTWKHIMRCVLNACAGTREYPNLPKEAR